MEIKKVSTDKAPAAIGPYSQTKCVTVFVAHGTMIRKVLS